MQLGRAQRSPGYIHMWGAVPKLLNREAPTSSMYSGSEADASQRLFRMKMLGRDRRSLTLWKNCFSCTRGKDLSGGAPPAKALGAWERRRRGYRLHQGRLRVGHQHKHISVQAKLVNPAVQLCGDIDARARGDRVKPISGTQAVGPVLPAVADLRQPSKGETAKEGVKCHPFLKGFFLFVS